jgi:hypothetical protein
MSSTCANTGAVKRAMTRRRESLPIARPPGRGTNRKAALHGQMPERPRRANSVANGMANVSSSRSRVGAHQDCWPADRARSRMMHSASSTLPSTRRSSPSRHSSRDDRPISLSEWATHLRAHTRFMCETSVDNYQGLTARQGSLRGVGHGRLFVWGNRRFSGRSHGWDCAIPCVREASSFWVT